LSRDCEELHLHLVFAAHCHQPLGNFDEVIEEACDRAYLPFLSVLAQHPDLRINLHYSGSLLEWLDTHRPDVLDTLAGIGEQIEWMGGAFYEPILPMIPERDARTHITLLSDFLQERFDQNPRGIWLTERVWEPRIAGLLADAGLEYTVLDDFSFLLAGYSPDRLTRSYTTDHLGKRVTVFPIAQDLRYAIPSAEPHDVLAMLEERHRQDPDGLVVIADDGEKFGLWPGSAERVYSPGNWLDRFLTLIQETDWLDITTFERHLDTVPAGRQVAIPPAGYREMSEWSLPAATAFAAATPEAAPNWVQMEAFMRGGWWPNFLVEYPEAGVLYRKMLRIAHHIEAGRGPAAAQSELLKAQGNDAYWHGVFGGLYAPYLRAATNRHLITAQTLIDAGHHRTRGWCYLRHVDWDADGRSEVEVELPDQSWVLDPSEGGCLLYFDDKPSQWSIGDVVARRFEAYHADLPTAPVYDRHTRRWLTDHLLPTATTAEAFAAVTYQELLALPEFEYTVEETTEGRGSARIEMSACDGAVSKTIQAENRLLDVEYQISGVPAGRFGPELPVAVWEGAGHIRVDGGSWQEIGEPLALHGHRFRLRHSGIRTSLLVVLRQPGTVFAFPLRTETRGDAGLASVTQGVVLWPHWSTDGDGTYQLSIEVVPMEDEES
jgi:alpha-amylase